MRQLNISNLCSSAFKPFFSNPLFWSHWKHQKKKDFIYTYIYIFFFLGGGGQEGTFGKSGLNYPWQFDSSFQLLTYLLYKLTWQ